MDFQYNFRQAHKDRLEDAGVIRYRHIEGVELKPSTEKPKSRVVRQIRFALATILNIFSR